MKVRIIAGPNGSGKSTLYYALNKDYKLNFGYFINADDIEKQLKEKGYYSVSDKLMINENKLLHSLSKSLINKKIGLVDQIGSMKVLKNKIHIADKSLINSYLAAAIAEFLRDECLSKKIDFSFESVFSDYSKVDFIKKLYKVGYQIYFYFVCTINSSINIERIKDRVLHHGHSVSEEKIKSRFPKSIKNAISSIKYTKRYFVIDNSQELNPEIVLEIENGKKINFKNRIFLPEWANNFEKNLACAIK